MVRINVTLIQYALFMEMSNAAHEEVEVVEVVEVTHLLEEKRLERGAVRVGERFIT